MTDNDAIRTMEEALKVAEDTINRQKAENERLKKTVVDLNTNITDLILQKKRTKAEAIKEFAERLKSLQIGLEISGESLYYVPIDCIDNLVKEMTEDENENY